MLAKRVEDVAKRRDGIVSPAEAMVADAGAKSILAHVDDYIAGCRRKGQDEDYVICKEKQIRSAIDSAGSRASAIFPRTCSPTTSRVWIESATQHGGSTTFALRLSRSRTGV